jgi:hydrogenase maturation protease
MKTLIIGLGNPILGDDAVGCRIAEEVEKQLKAQGINNVEVEQFYRGGIALMERLIGYDRALIIDSIQGRGGLPGTIHHITLDDLPTLTADSPHDASLKAALELGRRLGAQLPEDIHILAVEIKSTLEFSEELSPPVEASVPQIIELAIRWIIGST